VVAGGAGWIAAIDCATGRTDWSATVPFEDLGLSFTSQLAVFIVGNVVVATRLGDDGNDQTTLFSLATGEQVAQMLGDAVVASDGSMLGIVRVTSATITVTRYIPVP